MTKTVKNQHPRRETKRIFDEVTKAIDFQYIITKDSLKSITII